MALGYHAGVINSGVVPHGFDQTIFATVDQWQIIEIDGMIWWRPTTAKLGIVGGLPNDPLVAVGVFPFGSPVQNIHTNLNLTNYFYIAEPTVLSVAMIEHSTTIDYVGEWYGIKLHWRGINIQTAEVEWRISMGFPVESQQGNWTGHIRIGNS